MCKRTGNLQSQGPVVRSTYIYNFIYNEIQGSYRKQEGKSLPFQDPLVAWFRTNDRCGDQLMFNHPEGILAQGPSG